MARECVDTRVAPWTEPFAGTSARRRRAWRTMPASSPSPMRPIEPRLLQAFVAVAHEGHVSRAAQRLHRSQPALSQQLKELGERLGVELFQRGASGMLLTRDGAALLSHAERALDSLAEFEQAAQRVKGGGARGPLRIGTILDPEFTRLGAFLRELVALAPELEPELQHGVSGEVLERLQARTIDVGYYLGDPNHDSAEAGAGPRRPGEAFADDILTRFSYRVIAPPGWGPQVQGRGWSELVRLPWVATPQRSVHSRLLQALLQPMGLHLNRVALVDQEASMLSLVRSGVGLSLARDAVAMRESQREGLVIAEQVDIACDLRFVCLAQQRRRPAVQCAWQALRRAWRKAADD